MDCEFLIFNGKELAMHLDIAKAAKRFRNWTLYRLAIEMEISNHRVYSWKNGKVTPSLKNIRRICDILNCTPNDLFEF